MNAETLIKTAAKGDNLTKQQIKEAVALYEEAEQWRGHIFRRQGLTFEFKLMLAAVYVAGQIRGKQEDRRRRKRAGSGKGKTPHTP